MELELVKHISFNMEPTSIVMNEKNVISNLSNNNFSLKINLNKPQKRYWYTQTFSSIIGCNKSLKNKGNCVVTLLKMGHAASITVGLIDLHIAFGNRKIDYVALSEDGAQVAFFLTLNTSHQHATPNEKIENIYILNTSKFIATLDDRTNTYVDLGLYASEIDHFKKLNIIDSFSIPTHTHRHDSNPVRLVGGFSEQASELMVMFFDAKSASLRYFLFDMATKHLVAKSIPFAENNCSLHDCCIINEKIYVLCSKQGCLYSVDKNTLALSCMKSSHRHFIEMVKYQNKLISLVRNTSNGLYEVLDSNYFPMIASRDLSFIVASGNYFGVSYRNKLNIYRSKGTAITS